MRRGEVAVAIGLAIFSSTGLASAYCRTTTCDVDNSAESCTWDSTGCATSGISLFWPDDCGWFGVQKDGSPRRNISYDTLHAAVVSAFSVWSMANCGGGSTPALEMQDTDLLYGPVECQGYEFNRSAANASTWTLRDDSWPYVGVTTTFALTTLSVSISTGKILDADVEINSFGKNITASDANVGTDLASIVIHEAGHFLGLSHSTVSSAIMLSSYSPGTVARALSPDDEEGICAVYPPGRPPACGQPSPVFGFSKYCKGVNPSSEPAPPGSGGMTGGNPSIEPEPSDGGAANGNDASPRLRKDDGCGVGRGAPEGAAGIIFGAAFAGLALGRRFGSRRR